MPNAIRNSADETARKHSISREDQDKFALSSYSKADAAWKSGAFKEEIAPVTVPDARKGDTVVSEDEEYKKVIPSKVASLKPVFAKTGTVTAANASNLNDGASALILASKEKAAALGLKPLARVVGMYLLLVLRQTPPLTSFTAFADAACAPIDFTIAPSLAVPMAMKRAGITMDQVAKFEGTPASCPYVPKAHLTIGSTVNEAFSVVALANQKILNIPEEKLNVHGGAVACVSLPSIVKTRILTPLRTQSWTRPWVGLSLTRCRHRH
jgi:acetyl-CoA C-acetyltransferase